MVCTCADILQDLNSQSKLRTYKSYKFQYGKELYLTINLTRSQRSQLARLRSCTLPLKVETGRFTQIPYEQRLCTFCDQEAVEDEEHLVFACPFYITGRLLFYIDIFSTVPGFLDLSSSGEWNMIFSNAIILKRFSIFLSSALSKRMNRLYECNDANK